MMLRQRILVRHYLNPPTKNTLQGPKAHKNGLFPKPKFGKGAIENNLQDSGENVKKNDADDAKTENISETILQSSNQKYSKNPTGNTAFSKGSNTKKPSVNGCHFFQLNECKKKDCQLEHKGPVYGVCTLLECKLCKLSLKLCDPHKHKEGHCRNIHLEKGLESEAKQALSDQFKIVRQTKAKLIEADPSDIETINTLKDLLTLQLKQRKVFSDRIQEISFVLEKINTGKKSEKTENRILTDGFYLELKHLKAGLPAYSVKDQIVDELKFLKNPFCLVIGPTGSWQNNSNSAIYPATTQEIRR